MTTSASVPSTVITTTTITSHRRPRRELHQQETVVDIVLDFIRDHRLPPIGETISSWLVAGGCLLYYGGSYVVSCFLSTKSSRRLLRHHIPLMTDEHSREECTEQEVSLLIREIEDKLLPVSNQYPQPSSPASAEYGHDNIAKTLPTSEQIVQRVRSDISLRRLVSRVMTSAAGVQTKQEWQLYNLLDKVWTQLLRMPPISIDKAPTSSEDDQHGDDNCIDNFTVSHTKTSPIYQYEISLIIPAYRERGMQVASILRHALRMCDDPQSVEIIVVDAGECIALQHALAEFIDASQAGKVGLGNFLIKEYQGKLGRGSCLNFGASFAGGRLLTFLHSDTMIPEHWDTKVKTAFVPGRCKRLVHACSFCVGHNTSPVGLNGMPYPWGINAIWFLANLRASLFRLPYGDHVISMPTAYFRYVGGYPNQSIMEDYELMDLLRQRAAVLPEQIYIIPKPTAKCSVRRWQKFGVVYVTLVNAVLVHRYAHCGWLAEEIYEYYYCRSNSPEKSQ